MCRGGAVISGNTITAIFLYEINDLAAQNARLHRGRRRQDTGFNEQLQALKDVKAVEKRSKTSGELVVCHGCGVFRSIGSSIESDGHVHTQAKRCRGTAEIVQTLRVQEGLCI